MSEPGRFAPRYSHAPDRDDRPGGRIRAEYALPRAVDLEDVGDVRDDERHVDHAGERATEPLHALAQAREQEARLAASLAPNPEPIRDLRGRIDVPRVGI